MYQNKTYLAIVPARGGSKRLPKKNLKNLCGKPLIAWSINAGLDSKYIDKLIVSSDNDEILLSANKFGAEVIKRPPELSSDNAISFDAIKHALENSEYYDYVLLLQPTSPLRTEKHIDKAIEFLEEKSADAVISVCETDHSPLWANTLGKSLSMKDFLKADVLNKQSQDLEKYYRINGAIYIYKINKLLEQQTLFLKDNIFAYIMNKESSIDIDTKFDFLHCELYLNSTLSINE